MCREKTFVSLRLGCLPHLRTLTITHNRIKDADDLRGLTECPELSCVDLSHNKIDDPAVMDIFAEMQSLVRFVFWLTCMLTLRAVTRIYVVWAYTHMYLLWYIHNVSPFVEGFSTNGKSCYKES